MLLPKMVGSMFVLFNVRQNDIIILYLEEFTNTVDCTARGTTIPFSLNIISKLSVYMPRDHDISKKIVPLQLSRTMPWAMRPKHH
jgi:hypothetical protein